MTVCRLRPGFGFGVLVRGVSTHSVKELSIKVHIGRYYSSSESWTVLHSWRRARVSVRGQKLRVCNSPSEKQSSRSGYRCGQDTVTPRPSLCQQIICTITTYTFGKPWDAPRDRCQDGVRITPRCTIKRANGSRVGRKPQFATNGV